MALGLTEGPKNIISSAQDFTAQWVDLGNEIAVNGRETIAAWLNLDINDGANMRIRALAKHTSAHADEFLLPIKTVGTSDVKIEDEYFEFNVDADQKVVLDVGLDYVVNFIQFQIQAGTIGATACQVDSAVYTLGSSR